MCLLNLAIPGGVFLCAKYTGRAMIRRGGGAMVFTATVDAQIGCAGLDAYTAAKGGVVAMTRSLAAGLARHNIRVNAIAPGFVATFDRTAASFNNPDHVAIVLHNYRWRLSLAKGEARYDALEQKLAEAPVIAVPAITIASDFDGPAVDGTSYRKQFSGRDSHKILRGIGHNVPQEAPQAFAEAVIEVAGY